MPEAPGCAACQAPAEVQWRRKSVADPTHLDAVYACALHAIGLDAAAHIHQTTCTAPDPAHVPACNCTPTVQPQDPGVSPTVTLTTGWVVSGPTP
ncbi:hypothetical protein [Kitasatospora sp. NPDC001175]|uniref:hypothetical protein n=1 Tax=Kitasatospora sp. NPDC001175 TaxID=3157103 RepID=UPI003D06C13E